MTYLKHSENGKSFFFKNKGNIPKYCRMHSYYRMSWMPTLTVVVSDYANKWTTRVATVREKRKFFKVREKSGNVLKSQKIFDIVKVSEKSGYSVFRFIVHKFSSRLWNAFSFGKDEKYAAKQAKLSLWHSTPGTYSSCGQWFSLWMLSSKFLLPLSAKSVKNGENEKKNIDGLHKS